MEADKLDALRSLNQRRADFAKQWYTHVEPELNTALLLCDYEPLRQDIAKIRGDIREFLGEART